MHLAWELVIGLKYISQNLIFAPSVPRRGAGEIDESMYLKSLFLLLLSTCSSSTSREFCRVYPRIHTMSNKIDLTIYNWAVKCSVPLSAIMAVRLLRFLSRVFVRSWLTFWHTRSLTHTDTHVYSEVFLNIAVYVPRALLSGWDTYINGGFTPQKMGVSFSYRTPSTPLLFIEKSVFGKSGCFQFINQISDMSYQMIIVPSP